MNGKQKRDGCEVSNEVSFDLSPHPKDGSIVFSKVIRILCNSLGLPYSAQADKRLRRNSSSFVLRSEPIKELLQ
jgi:hypothetical protein